MSFWSRLFGGEAKASRVGGLLSLGWAGLPRWPDRNYERLAREGYRQNIIAYASMSRVATAFASVPLVAYRSGKVGRMVEVEGSRTVQLITAPNATMLDGASFRVAWASYLQIAGNAYTERVDGLDGKPIELHLWRPDRVKIVPGADGYPEAYEYSVNGYQRRVVVEGDPRRMPILHVRQFHPIDDWYGMSPLDPAAFSVDVHTDAGRWNKALLGNSARPPGAFVYEGDPDGGNQLSDEQLEQLKHDLEERFAGTANAGRPLILQGGLKWQAMGLDPVDMDFVEGKNAAAREIALAFGVPPMLLGIPGDNTYSNYQEANRAFFEQTVLPLADRFCAAMTAWLAPAMGEDVRLGYDADEIPALETRRAEKWARVSAADFISIDEKREAVGYEATAGGDKVLVPATLVPLEDAGADLSGGPEPDPNEGGGVDA